MRTSESTSIIEWFRTRLQEECKQLTACSDQTIRRTLKKDLGMSFKKTYRIAPKVTQPTNIRNLCECAMLLHSMESSGIELIYFDEFSISSKQFAFKSWSK